MNTIKTQLIFLLLILYVSSYSQQNTSKTVSGWGVAAKASTFGLGLELVKSFNFPINLRFGGTYFKNTSNISFYSDKYIYSVNHLTLGALSILIDWQATNFFHLTIGTFINFSEDQIIDCSKDNIYFGDIKINNNTMGSISTTYSISKINPYFGIGFGRSISKDNVVSFGVDFGISYIGKLITSLSSTGMLQPTSEPIPTNSGMLNNIDIINNNIKDFIFFPYINLQLSFKLSKNKTLK